MAVLDILCFPDKRLRQICEPVEEVTDEIRQLVDDMFETMYASSGIGLAAIQVNVHKRIIVVDVSEDRSDPICLINPEIVETEDKVESEEGCLSVPGFYEMVERAGRIKVKALDYHGKPLELEADGRFSVCIQHEIDHLNGNLFVDYLSTLKRQRIQKKLEKTQRRGRPVRRFGASKPDPDHASP